ncbi:MAG: hypothetical protein ACYDIB_05530 [Desulfobulbia bacterium]
MGEGIPPSAHGPGLFEPARLRAATQISIATFYSVRTAAVIFLRARKTILSIIFTGK